jgi:hypothetical protein
MRCHLTVVVAVLLAVAIVGVPWPSARVFGFARWESFDDEFWMKSTIVVAKVLACNDPTDAAKPAVVVLEPIATLSGKLDPAITKSIVAELWFGPLCLIQEKPTAGKNVLVLLCQRVDADRPDIQYRVEQGACRFMPEGLSLIEIEGLTDQRIAEVASAVRKLRAESKVPRTRNVAKP